MKTFYIIQMIDGKYIGYIDELYHYVDTMDCAAFFDTEEIAIRLAPTNQAFTVIKFYDK